MEFYDVINKRRTVRKFTSQPIEREKIIRILNTGIKAPSHNHLRTWEFILIPEKTIRFCIVESGEKLSDNNDVIELQKLFTGMDPKASDMYIYAMNVQKKMIMSAPEVLIPIFENRTPISECTTIYELNSFASIWCVIENILLAMTNEGLGGVTYVPKNTISIKRILEVPEKYEIPAIIPFGYPDSTEKKIEQIENTVNEKIHINKF